MAHCRNGRLPPRDGRLDHSGRAHLRRGQEQLAHRHGSLDVRQHLAGHSRHTAHAGGPCHRSLHSRGMGRLYRQAPLPRCSLPHHRRESPSCRKRHRLPHRERNAGHRKCAAAGRARYRGAGTRGHGLSAIITTHPPRRYTARGMCCYFEKEYTVQCRYTSPRRSSGCGKSG